MTIYEIDARIADILMRTDEETGELPEDAVDELVTLAETRDFKIENAACLIINLNAEAKAIRDQEITLAQRRKSIENRVERIKGYVEYATAGEPFNSPRVQVKYSKSTAVEIEDNAFWSWCVDHPEYARRKDPEPDKTAIKAALKAGEVIPGASLVEHRNISIK